MNNETCGANSGLPVLLIEDDPKHADQIKNYLDAKGFCVTHSSSGAEADVFAFKANAISTQLVVVDLQLISNREAGATLVRKILWPLDRGAFFVVFSQIVNVEDFRVLGRIDPNWVLLKKEFEPGSSVLTEGSLVELQRILDECRSYVVPHIEHSQFDLTNYLAIIDDFQRLAKTVAHQTIFNELRKSISTSVSRLNQLSHECASFARAGLSAANISVAVYGSYGRLEARSDSDIEFSVFYSGSKDEEAAPDLIASMWNRLAFALSTQKDGVPFEHEWRIKEGKLLLAKDVGNGLPNKYCETICIASLEQSFSEAPLLRNRHLQLLCECRAVFNPVAFRSMKQRALDACLRPFPTRLETFVHLNYLESLLAQFELDTAQEGDLDWKNWKKFCYRSLNALALRVGLAGELAFRQNRNLSSPSDWDTHLDWLAFPGVLKLMRFHNLLSTEYGGDSDSSSLLVAFSGLIYSYTDAIGMLGLSEGEFSLLRSKAVEICEEFSRFIETLAKHRRFIEIKKNDPWLFDCNPIRRLRERLLAPP